MTDLTKIAGSEKHRSSLGVTEIAAVTVVVLLVAVQVMYIDKHPVTLNAATAELAPFGIIGP